MEAISTQPVRAEQLIAEPGRSEMHSVPAKPTRRDVMNRMKATLSLAGLALLWLMLCTPVKAQQPPDNVEGNWTIYSTSIQNGETVVKHVQITQSGNRLSGFFEGPDQSGPIQGEIHGNYLRFSTVTKNVLNFGGHVYGDRISGSYGLHGKHAAWQAVRTTPVAEAATPVTGTVYAYQPVLAPPAPPPAPAPVAVDQYVAPPPATASAAQGTSGPTPQPLSADQLDSLVAPIALYPDALVAQVLAASANPDQVAYADDWMAQNKSLTGTALAQAVDQQSWDPSVKALTQFPSVLDNLAHNLSWTSSLGQAFANQQADVMQAVQTMRAKTQAAGTLQSTNQIVVTQSSPSTIVIQPANPQVVYVPQYNPAVVYGAPVVVPLYVPPPVPVAAVGLYFGTGITIGATFGGGGWGGGFGWGWHAWNVNWGGGGGGSTIIYNNNTYINNHIWNNRPYNSYRPWAGGAAGTQNNAYYAANGTYHPDANYHPGTETHYGPNGQYRANGSYGPDGGWHPDVNHAGGATGTENPGYYDKNGSYRPGTDTHYGPNGAYHPDSYYGPQGALHPDVPGTNPQDQPNGGQNGNHGLIGGNGGTQHTAQADIAHNGNNGGQLMGANRNDSNHGAVGQNRSAMSGNGRSARAESNRGRASMQRSGMHNAAVRRPAMHSQPARSGGGERRR
jgi:hypothetical protein